jgi:acyl-CoA synthetase (AMP-forming)/AMP-acid ligase II/thioesterase domain-containing protein/acyl carrier protein
MTGVDELAPRLRGGVFLSAMVGWADGAFCARHGRGARMVQIGALIADAEDRSHDDRYLLPLAEDEMTAVLRRQVEAARAGLGDIPLCLNGAVADLDSGLKMARAWQAAGGDLFELNCHGTYRRLVERGRLQAMALPENRPLLLGWLSEFCRLDIPLLAKFRAPADGVDTGALLDDISGVEGLFGIHLNVRGPEGRPAVDLVRSHRSRVPGILLCSGYVRKPRHLKELAAAGADCIGVAEGLLEDHGLLARLAGEYKPPDGYGPEPMCIPDLIAHHAERTPDAPAVLAPGSRALTYAGLQNHIAHTVGRLNAMGIERGDRVAQVLPHGAMAAVAYLALASGGTCFPLDPDLPLADLLWRLDFAEARAVVVPEGEAGVAAEAARQLGLALLTLRPAPDGPAGLAAFLGDEPDPLPEPAFSRPADIALIIATSGTTDRPKLVPLSHINIMTAARDTGRPFGLTAEDRHLCIAPLFHTAGLVSGVLTALVSGGSVALGGPFDARAFFGWMDELQPTWYGGVPTMHRDILAQAGAYRDVIDRRPMRVIRCGGAPAEPELLERLGTAFGTHVCVSYGLTETGPRLAENPLPPDPAKRGSVGPSAGPEIGIMDVNGALLAAGEEGEIVARGANVMAGYLKNPQANAQSFANGWFRTGDVGYLDEDGYLFLTGRVKELINCGGLKVAPAEVEAVLRLHPSVREAVAFAVPDDRLGEQVGAAVVLRQGAATGQDELERFAGERLAPYKVPRRIAFLEQIPRSATRKVQRGEAARVAARVLGLAAAGREDRRPATEEDHYELGLRGIWQDLLGVQWIGLNDSFFGLGGDSIAAAQMFARVEAVMGLRLTPAAFYGEPTIAGLASVLRKEAAAGRIQTVAPVKATGSRLPLFFVVPAGAWFATDLARHMAPDQPLYAVHPLAVVSAAAPEIDFRALVSHYVESVRAVRPEGPYLLGGVSAGGRLAFEMARQMMDEGHDVALVAMLDTGLRRTLVPPFWGVHAMLVRTISSWARLRRAAPADRAESIGRAARRAFGAVTGRRQEAGNASDAVDAYVDAIYAHVYRLIKAHRRSLRGHRAEPLGVRMAYFWAEGTRILALRDPRIGWEKLARGGFVLHKVPGDHHMAMMEPHVAVFAEKLEACLREAQRAVVGGDERPGD